MFHLPWNSTLWLYYDVYIIHLSLSLYNRLEKARRIWGPIWKSCLILEGKPLETSPASAPLPTLTPSTLKTLKSLFQAEVLIQGERLAPQIKNSPVAVYKLWYTTDPPQGSKPWFCFWKVDLEGSSRVSMTSVYRALTKCRKPLVSTSHVLGF